MNVTDIRLLWFIYKVPMDNGCYEDKWFIDLLSYYGNVYRC